jgi:hypothetical protein
MPFLYLAYALGNCSKREVTINVACPSLSKYGANGIKS